MKELGAWRLESPKSPLNRSGGVGGDSVKEAELELGGVSTTGVTPKMYKAPENWGVSCREGGGTLETAKASGNTQLCRATASHSQAAPDRPESWGAGNKAQLPPRTGFPGSA